MCFFVFNFIILRIYLHFLLKLFCKSTGMTARRPDGNLRRPTFGPCKDIMPNPIAYMMLLIWPIVCLGLFRNLPLQRALIWSILGGYLFLPPLAEFNLLP